MRRIVFRPQHVAVFRQWASTAPIKPFQSKPQGAAYISKPQRVAPSTPPGPTRTPIPSKPPKAPPSAEKIWRWRKPALVAASLSAAIISAYIFQMVLVARQPCSNPAVSDPKQQKDVAGVYDGTAESFDAEVGISEMLMGVNWIRKRLARMCKGDVLEASCGTGRNLGYFDLSKSSKIDSLTFVDLSPRMVGVCKRKWEIVHGRDKSSLKPGLIVRFLTGSALSPMPLAPTGKKYKTIIQTMGLCSTDKPATLLANLAEHLDRSDPDARILLLEHGRSYLPWLNNILDNSAERHAEIHGCWFNRDIGVLVEEASAKAGLEIVREKRRHLGTTWLFELKSMDASQEQRDHVSETSTERQEQDAPGLFARLGWK